MKRYSKIIVAVLAVTAAVAAAVAAYTVKRSS